MSASVVRVTGGSRGVGRAMVREIENALGPVDGLFNNAGPSFVVSAIVARRA